MAPEVAVDDRMSFSSVGRRFHARGLHNREPMQLPKSGSYMVAWFQVEHESCRRMQDSVVVPVSPPGGRRGRRCSSRGATAREPRPVAQKRRGLVVDEQSVDGPGGKTCLSKTRDMFTHGQL